MANLLPIYSKKNIHKEYLLRLVIVFLFLLSVLITSALVLLFPSHTLSSLKFNLVSEQLEFEKGKTASPEEDRENKKIIRDINSKLASLREGNVSGLLAYNTINRLVQKKGNDITIHSFFFSKGSKDTNISLNGVAASRAALLSFTNMLKDEERYSSLDLPISNFVKERDISFSIQITLNTLPATKNNKEQ